MVATASDAEGELKIALQCHRLGNALLRFPTAGLKEALVEAGIP